MIRKTFALALLLAAVSAVAQNRGRVVPSPVPLSGATVSGMVTAVNGSNVSLANGLVVLDVSQATITDDRGRAATIAPGSIIFAVLKSSNSLQASAVFVTQAPQVSLSGTVQSVNASAGTFQLLGLTVHTDANTSFGGGHSVRRLSDIVPGDIVAVQANAAGQNLVATSVLAFAQIAQPAPTLLHGTVKNIGTDSWVITDSRRGDVTVSVNSQTRILGSPKVGDTVDVLANVDSANNFVAISISISPVSSRLHFTGVVKQIGANSWTIDDRIVQVNSKTIIIGNPKVGDTVDVVLDPSSALNVALAITLLPSAPSQHVTGVVKSIAPHTTLEPCPVWGCIVATWTLGPGAGMMGPDFLVTQIGSTTLGGNPKVGDRVDAVVEMKDGALVALSITKL